MQWIFQAQHPQKSDLYVQSDGGFEGTLPRG